MHLRKGVKMTAFIAIILSVFLLHVPVSPGDDRTSLTVRDMLYTITDPENASSTFVLAFLRKEKNPNIGDKVEIGDKFSKASKSKNNVTRILTSMGFPDGSFLVEDSDGANREQKRKLVEFYKNIEPLQNPSWCPIIDKNGVIFGFNLYPNNLYRAKAVFPDWAQRKRTIQMWLEPNVLVVEYYTGSPKVLYLDVNYSIVKSFLDMPCKDVFDRLTITLGERSDEMYRRFMDARKALEFLETNPRINESEALVHVTEAVVHLGILRNEIGGIYDLVRDDQIWAEPIRTAVLSMSARLAPQAKEIFTEKANKFQDASNGKWENFLFYFAEPHWKKILEICEVSSDEIVRWDEINSNLVKNYEKYRELPRDTEDLDMLSLRLERLKSIRDDISQMRSLRLDSSRAVQNAIKIMGWSKNFYINEGRDLYCRILTEKINEEIKDVSDKVNIIIVEELKKNVKKYVKDPVKYVKQGRIFLEGYYTNELPVIGKAFKKGGVSGKCSLKKVKWIKPDKDNMFDYRVIGTTGVAYVHVYVEGNINLPPIGGGESREQKMRLHLVRPLVLEKGKYPLDSASEEMSLYDFEKHDSGNRVFVAEIKLNRKPVADGYFESVIRSILFEVYDK
ncbi:MAG TPA: hypothetical protein PKI14_11345 [Fervidobacterium sp.]|nr:hypothetical protein [Fervidobacterium sp.]